jgi:hypothetical protein
VLRSARGQEQVARIRERPGERPRCEVGREVTRAARAVVVRSEGDAAQGVEVVRHTRDEVAGGDRPIDDPWSHSKAGRLRAWPPRRQGGVEESDETDGVGATSARGWDGVLTLGSGVDGRSRDRDDAVLSDDQAGRTQPQMVQSARGRPIEGLRGFADDPAGGLRGQGTDGEQLAERTARHPLENDVRRSPLLARGEHALQANVLDKGRTARGVDDLGAVRVVGGERAHEHGALEGLVDGAPGRPVGPGPDSFLEPVPSREHVAVTDALQLAASSSSR